MKTETRPIATLVIVWQLAIAGLLVLLCSLGGCGSVELLQWRAAPPDAQQMERGGIDHAVVTADGGAAGGEPAAPPELVFDAAAEMSPASTTDGGYPDGCQPGALYPGPHGLERCP